MLSEANRVVNQQDRFLLLTISSPSGAGKSTLIAKLRERVQDMRFSISHTTRPPRANEKDGCDYHFTDRSTFRSMVEADAFVEWAEVHGNLYGTSDREISEARGAFGGVLFDVDCHGARQIRSRYADAVSVLILPPSLVELERRLRQRASDSEESITRRLQAAIGEISYYGVFDYIVVNDCLEEASEQLYGILLAERCRRSRRARMAESLLRTSRWC